MKTRSLVLTSAAAVLAVVVAVNAQKQSADPVPGRQALLSRVPPFTSPAAMQAEFVRRFEASPGFGLSRVIRPVFLAPVPALVWNGATYPVTPPELLALEDDPVAYAPREHSHRFAVSTNELKSLRSEVRRQFQHRPLTELETNAVLALRAGRDIVVMTNRVTLPEAAIERLPLAPELLVVGALRAQKDCAACHQCEPGTLLGAFAFKLSPLGPAAGGTNAPGADSNLVARLTAPFPLPPLSKL